LQKVAKVAKYESKNLLEQRLTTINNVLTTEKVPKVPNLIYDIFYYHYDNKHFVHE